MGLTIERARREQNYQKDPEARGERREGGRKGEREEKREERKEEEKGGLRERFEDNSKPQ